MQLSLAKHIRTIYEIGAGAEFTCQSRPFWDSPATTVVLFEPNPILYADLVRKTCGLSNVTVHNVAIYNENRLGYLVSAGVLSYLPEVASPINTIFRGKLTPMLDPFKVVVNRMTFDTFDPGDIELLYLGMEGAEHTVFPYLRSRPHLIILNNHFANDYGYAFPYFEVIHEWCKANGYQVSGGIPYLTLVNLASLRDGSLVQSP